MGATSTITTIGGLPLAASALASSSADQSSSGKTCQSTNQCEVFQEVCQDGICVPLGTEAWVFAASAIGGLLLVSILAGCFWLCPNCPGSRRFAHPSEKRRKMDQDGTRKNDENYDSHSAEYKRRSRKSAKLTLQT